MLENKRLTTYIDNMYHAIVYVGHKKCLVHISTYQQEYWGYPCYCPHCDTRLDYVDYYSGPYFRHVKNSPVAQNECDLYVSSFGGGGGGFVSSTYTPPDVPFYLEKIGNSFQVSIGLPRISKYELDNLSHLGHFCLESSFSGGYYNWHQIASVKISGLVSEQVNLIPLPELSLLYRINGIPLNVRPRGWKSLGCSLSNGGTLFHIYDISDKFRSVADDGNIYVHVPYYLLIKKSGLPRYTSYLKILETAPIIAGNSKDWNLFKIVFTENSVDAKNFAKVKLSVNLCEKPAEVVPLWPPMISHEQVSYGETSTQYYLKEKGQIFCSIVDENINGVKHELIEVPTIGKQATKFRLDSDYNAEDTVFFVSPNPYATQYKQPSLVVKWNKHPIKIEKEIHLKEISKDNTLSLESTLKSSCIRTKKEILQTVILLDEEKNVNIPNPERKEKLVVYHGQDIATTIIIESRAHPKKNNGILSDDELFYLLKSSSDFQMATPINMKYSRLSSIDYPKSAAYLRQCILKGRIGKNACRYIMKILKEGDNYE